VHRLVVLPDYQGIGLGVILLNFIANYFSKMGFRIGITTSQPALNFKLKKDNNWSLIRVGRAPLQKKRHKFLQKCDFTKTSSSNRITASWFYKNR
jgi:GNAT superfamily N-acetyltransferase